MWGGVLRRARRVSINVSCHVAPSLSIASGRYARDIAPANGAAMPGDNARHRDTDLSRLPMYDVFSRGVGDLGCGPTP